MNDPKAASEIQKNLEEVERRICLACERAGRRREDVTLIAVSKTKPVEAIREAIQCGIRTFGENRVQELMEKQEACSDIRLPLQWHMIGHLQSNKVKYLIGKTALIHSVDSLALAQKIEAESAKKGCITKILMEINIAGEESKFGVSPEKAVNLAMEFDRFRHIQLCGLMTVAPFTQDPEENRKYFCKMRKLLIDIVSKTPHNSNMGVLSMGMTGDYEVAIEEGATCIRVGTGIFGSRTYPETT